MNRKVAFCIARDGVAQSGFVRYQARSLGATPRPYSSLSDGQKLGVDDENVSCCSCSCWRVDDRGGDAVVSLFLMSRSAFREDGGSPTLWHHCSRLSEQRNWHQWRLAMEGPCR